MLCSNLKFILVEDHQVQRRLVTYLLRRLGAREVYGCEDGASALQAMDDPERPADIMVLDLSMPGMDGIDLIRKLSGTKYPISIILYSARQPNLLASVSHMAERYRVNLLGSVSKPLTEANLAPLISLYREGLQAQ